MNSRFETHPTRLAGLLAIRRLAVTDNRGWLERLFCAEDFALQGVSKPVVQINRTLTRHHGTVRGLHFQYPPHAEIKIVSCLRGEVFDVAVDLREGSLTFLRWHGEILSADNRRSLLIPEGFAHGFQTLTDDCELLYCHTATYTPSAEGGIHPREPRIGVKWPLPITDLSPRDDGFALLNGEFSGLRA